MAQQRACKGVWRGVEVCARIEAAGREHLERGRQGGTIHGVEVPDTAARRTHGFAWATRHGSEPQGTANPTFLDSSRFSDEVAGPTLEVFRNHTGPLILEFPAVPKAHRHAPAAFVERVEQFLTAIPRELPMAVEVRDKQMVKTEHARMRARSSAGHMDNSWIAMPMPAGQVQFVPLDTAPFVVVRWTLCPGIRYDERKHAFAPFDRLVGTNEEMRAQGWALLRACISDARAAVVLVNNKAEGAAPLTRQTVVAGLAEPRGRGTGRGGGVPSLRRGAECGANPASDLRAQTERRSLTQNVAPTDAPQKPSST